MADVIRKQEYYDTQVLLPGFTVPGYESELDITKAHYSTDFSSNPIGSKVDFFSHLNDPCLDEFSPNPIFTINKSLSSLDPQWFDGWWDQAMFYSHPLVTEQISANYPNVYRNYSDSVGFLTYASEETDPASPLYGNDAISPSLKSKIPTNILNNISGLHASIESTLSKFTPPGQGPKKTTLLTQIKAFSDASKGLQNIVANKAGVLKNKLPFSTNIKGNLLNNNNWNHKYKIEGLDTAVDKVNNVIKAPSRMLNDALVKIKNLIPKIKLPSIPKLLNLSTPKMPAVSRVVEGIKTASGAVKAAIGAAAATVAAAKDVANQVTGAVGSVVGTINQTTQQIKSVVDTTTRAAAAVQNFNKTISQGGVSTTLINYSNNQTTNLNKNAAVTLDLNTPNSKGDPATVKITTSKYPPA